MLTWIAPRDRTCGSHMNWVMRTVTAPLRAQCFSCAGDAIKATRFRSSCSRRGRNQPPWGDPHPRAHRAYRERARYIWFVRHEPEEWAAQRTWRLRRIVVGVSPGALDRGVALVERKVTNGGEPKSSGSCSPESQRGWPTAAFYSLLRGAGTTSLFSLVCLPHGARLTR